MPDVDRSDSQRSADTLRPRVSFNRDVHVKRIVPRQGVINEKGDGYSASITTPYRKEKLSKSKEVLAEEAAKVLNQVDSVNCYTQSYGEKFHSLPTRSKKKKFDNKRRNSDEFPVDTPPKKPPRIFANYQKSTPASNTKNSIFNIFKRNEQEIPTSSPSTLPKKSNLRRSVSDATNLKSNSLINYNEKTNRKRNGSESEDVTHVKTKKNLSPIIEAAQREDYFTNKQFDENKENVEEKQSDSVTQQIKDLIDEIDQELYKKDEIKLKQPNKKKPPEIVVIDVEKAEKINNKKTFGSKFKFLQKDKKLPKNPAKYEKKSKEEIVEKENKRQRKEVDETLKRKLQKEKDPSNSVKSTNSPEGGVKKAIDSLENSVKRSPEMIHSSQKPVDKPPLTKGYAVDRMVKRLSYDNSSPPPKTNVMVLPNVSIQHNNNQPFSYTRGLSPEHETRNRNVHSPVIYAQVVCEQNGSGSKQTVHTAYTNGKKHLPHSDSDEGLGYEENSHGVFNNRKYEPEKNLKNIIHFGDEPDGFHRNDDFFNEEYPIMPKFKNVEYNGFKSFDDYKTEHNIFIDSSSRGRGDGMDSKRRESLTENFDNLNITPRTHYALSNSRNDLSARRDQLESRLLNRRFGEKSPECRNNNVNVSREITTKYYRSGSASPVGYKDKYVTETRVDKDGKEYTTESRNRKYFGDDDYRKNYRYIEEPKSFDSQLSDYRSSPEASHDYRSPYHKYKSKTIVKDKDHYKSNPEIAQIRDYKYDMNDYRETYHDSLKRDKLNTSQRYYDQNEERKDKFGDSGIENDFRRDSGDNYLTHRQKTHHHQQHQQQQREFSNESEDEGFASSLLIASERQHTDDNINNRRHRRDYEYDNNNKSYHKDKQYNNNNNNRHMDNSDYKKYKTKDRSNEYAPRERSIDDGSHFDPRIDKDFDNNNKGTLKRINDKKPPKPEKKSSLEKVKQLFTRDSKKNKKDKKNVNNNQEMVTEEVLRSRYTEYKGSRDNLLNNSKHVSKRNEQIDSDTNFDYSNRRRLSTPSPSPTREIRKTNVSTNGSWFKSLDRLSRKKSKNDDKYINHSNTEEELPPIKSSTKNLRFFGDTDLESNDSIRHKSIGKLRTPINKDRNRSQSTRDLHNIREERSPEIDLSKRNHKSMLNISETDRELKGSRLSLKPPMSPVHRPHSSTKIKDERNRRRKNEVSSVESSTEGDSSQQSQRSVVYLHAPTVGDIPGPGHLRNGRRAASREELASNTSSSRIQPQVKTLSRSFSVLAPWRPKHYRESLDIDYTQYQKPVKNGKYEQKPSRNGSSRKESTSTLKKKAQETRRSNQNMSTLNRKSRSKDNVSSSSTQTLKRSKDKGSSSTLYKKKEKQPKENTRYISNKDDKKFSKSMSVESLSGHRRNKDDNREISRSISMPRDPEKSAGWFRINKKTKTK